MPSVVSILHHATRSALVSRFPLFNCNTCHGFGWITVDIINQNDMIWTYRSREPMRSQFKASFFAICSIVTQKWHTVWKWHTAVTCVSNVARCHDRLLVCYNFNFSAGKMHTHLSVRWIGIKPSEPWDKKWWLLENTSSVVHPTLLKHEQLSGSVL